MIVMLFILNMVICMIVIGIRFFWYFLLLLLCSLVVIDLLWVFVIFIYYMFVLCDLYMCFENGEEVVFVGNFFFLVILSNLIMISRDCYLVISKLFWYCVYLSILCVVKVIIFNWFLSVLMFVFFYWFKFKNMFFVIYFEGVFYLLFIVLVLVIVYNYVGFLFVSRRYVRNI